MNENELREKIKEDTAKMEIKDLSKYIEKVLPLAYAHPDILQHWQSIVDGNVPFGYKVK